MEKKRIITIGREFGSGGRTIGKEVADRLGIPCYDHELIDRLAERERAFQGIHHQRERIRLPQQLDGGGVLLGALVRRAVQPGLSLGDPAPHHS